MADKHITQFQNAIAHAEARMALATTYADDGAFASAARCLREAASAYEEAQSARQDALIGAAS